MANGEYEAASTVYTRQEFPTEWHRLQNSFCTRLILLLAELDVYFISSSPVELWLAYTVEEGTRHVQNGGAEG
jgi:hypothetical protein